MELKRAITLGTLEEIRLRIVESRSPGSRVILNGRYYVLVVPGKGRVAAVGLKRLSWFATEIKHLVVNPKERRRGYGRAIVRLALERVRTPLAIATVREDNLPSRKLFREIGFEEVTAFLDSRGGIRLLSRPTPAPQAEPSGSPENASRVND